MLTSRLLRVLVSVLAVLSVVNAQSGQPSLLFHDANTVATQRLYAGCAINVHQIGQYSATPTMMAFGGSTFSYSLIASYDITQTGGWDNGVNVGVTPTINYSPGNYTGSGCNPLGRASAGAVWTSAGNVVIAGGKGCPTWAQTNDVIYSTDGGVSYNLATLNAQWVARSDMEMVVEPNTNNIVIIGGQNINSIVYNDVWVSTDGLGAVWTQLTSAGPFQPIQQGAATFLYDAASNTNGIATLVLYSPVDNMIYTSTTRGQSWTAGYNFANTLLIDPSFDARMVAGADNAIYIAGGADDEILFSPASAKGSSWASLNNSNWSPNVSNTVALDGFQFGCVAIRYQKSSTSPSGYHDQLVIFGGNVTIEDLLWSGFQCLFDEGTQVVTSVVAEIIQPGETYSVANSNPPAAVAPQLVHHDAGQWLSYRLYADCEYDRHQAATKSSGLKMWQMGGFTSGYSYIDSVDFTSTGSWLGLQEFNEPSYTGASSTPSGRVAAGVAYLYNGNLLYFGGKDNASAVYTNDVYMSTNNGQSFTYVGLATFTPRSDFATAVLPMTNTVVILGGAYSSTGASSGTPINDVWYSTDGQGKTWTQSTAAGPFPPFQDAAFTALYNSATVNSTAFTAQYPTLILYTGGYEDIFYSTTLGATWTTAAAPWSLRLHGMFVADADNWVYFTGGSEDGQIWFSWNSGVTWTNLNTASYQNANFFNGGNGANTFVPSSYYLNLFNYLGVTGGTGSCMAVRYTANSASPNGYHKTLVLYGGANVYAVSSLPSASCVLQEAVNVLYTEVMRPSELSNSAWTDTSVAAVPANTVPAVTFNSPTVLMTYRQFPTCAYDVHSLTSHPSSPTTFVLGGWDQNNNVLATYDIVNGTQFSTYQYVASWGPNNNPPNGRTGAGAAYLANGNLIWFGGKTNADSTNNNMVNDVWAETSPLNRNGRWQRSRRQAPWYARSDMSVSAMPGTNCLVMIGGTQLSGAQFNDVWSSCDGIGQNWTQQTGAAPWWPSQQGAMTALFDGTASGGSQSSATILYYPSYNQLMYSSVNMGSSWTSLGVVPWTYRQAARFVSDAESNVYMVGGYDSGSIAADNTNSQQQQSLNDVWMSTNKGVNWYQMRTTTNNAYTNPVQPSSVTYACLFLNYQSGSGPNGYHRQLAVVGGFQQVYSSQLQLAGFDTFANTQFRYPECICDEINGVRAMAADLIFPGESVSGNVVSGGSSSGNKFSSGATAGIAVGVAVAAVVLTSLVWCLLGGALAGLLSRSGSKSTGSNKSTRFDDEPSHNTQSGVEMHSNEEGQAPTSP